MAHDGLLPWEEPAAPNVQEHVDRFRVKYGKVHVWTPRKHDDPRQSIWSLNFTHRVRARACKEGVPPSINWNPPPPPRLKKQEVKKKDASFISAEQLEQLAAEHLFEADKLEATKPAPSLKVQLGQLVVTKEDLQRVLKAWDKGKEFLKGEFRINLRNIGLTVSSAQADELFDSWDDDGGGSLDIKELKIALGACQKAALQFESKSDPNAERAGYFRKRAAMAQEAATVTEQATALEKAHRNHVLDSDMRPDLQLGALLYRRRVKPGAMVAIWSEPRGPHEGELAKADFGNFCVSLGLPHTVSVSAILDVFDQYDEDKGGYMDVDEAKNMIKKLQVEAENSEQKARAMDREAQAMRAKANKLAAVALIPIDEEGTKQLEPAKLPPPTPKLKSPKSKSPKRKPKNAITGVEYLEGLRRVDVELEEEAQRLERAEEVAMKAALRIQQHSLAAAFETWLSTYHAHTQMLAFVSGQMAEWMQPPAARGFQQWTSFALKLKERARISQLTAARYAERMLAIDWQMFVQKCSISRKERGMHSRAREFRRRWAFASSDNRTILTLVLQSWRRVLLGRKASLTQLPTICASLAKCMNSWQPTSSSDISGSTAGRPLNKEEGGPSGDAPDVAPSARLADA